MPAGQTSAVSGEGKIDAREGRGDEVKTGRQVADAEIVDVAKEKVVAAESAPVHLLLARRNVVGENALPAKRLYRLSDQADAGKELREAARFRRIVPLP